MWLEFVVQREMKNTRFKIDILFGNIEVLKKAINQYGIISKVYVKFIRITLIELMPSTKIVMDRY